MDIDAYRWDKLRNLLKHGYVVCFAEGWEDDEDSGEDVHVFSVSVQHHTQPHINMTAGSLEDLIDSISNPLQS